MRYRWTSTLAIATLLVALGAVPAPAQPEPRGLRQRIQGLEQQLADAQAAIGQLQAALAAEAAARAAADAALQQAIGNAVPAVLLALAGFLTIDPNPKDGLAGPHVILEGVNVHIRSGSGTSHDGAFEYERFITTGQTPLGLGNLIVGYNEPYPFEARPRTGSHNVVIGPWHGYSGAAGLITGLGNTASSVFNALAGGPTNVAGDAFAVVSGGAFNDASGWQSAVSGGFGNTASGWLGVVSGGEGNTAESSPSFGRGSVVSGGMDNTATDGGVVSGGTGNSATGYGQHAP